MSEISTLPIVDFSSYSLGMEETDTENLELLGKDIVKGLCSHNAIYIINHGFPESMEEHLTEVSEEFFSLPLDVKQQYARPSLVECFGYTAPEVETTNPKRPPGYKETFNFPTYASRSQRWPDKEVPDFRTTVSKFTNNASRLVERFYTALALGLGVKDKEFFLRTHNMYSKDNQTTLRTVNYMAIPDGHELKPGQIRCGEHTDFGTISFIFQDSAGGLEILNKEGVWVPIEPVKGAILVLGGVQLQRYTNNRILAVEHRVVIPEDKNKRNKPRRSHVLFTMPDDHIEVTPCTGENPTYSPVDYEKYFTQRFKDQIPDEENGTYT